MTTDPNRTAWVRAFLLLCPLPETRAAFESFVAHAISAVRPYEQAFFFERESDAVRARAKTVALWDGVVSAQLRIAG